MKGANIYAGIVAAVWLCLVWLGMGLMRDLYAQHIPDFPNRTQVVYYVGVPVMVFTIFILATVVLNGVIRMPVVLVLITTGALMFLPAYMITYTGGM